MGRISWVENYFVLHKQENDFLVHFGNPTDSLRVLRSWDGRFLAEQPTQEDDEELGEMKNFLFTMSSSTNRKCLDAVPELGKAAFRECSPSLSQYWIWMGNIKIITRQVWLRGRFDHKEELITGRKIANAKYQGLCLSYAGALRDCELSHNGLQGVLHWRCNNSNPEIEDNSGGLGKAGFLLRVPFNDHLPTKRVQSSVLKDSLKVNPYVPGETRWFDSRTGNSICSFY